MTHPPYNSHQLEPYLATLVRKNRLPVKTCLDVGCGKNPVNGWFRSIAGRISHYTAADVDPEAIDELRSRGLRVLDMREEQAPLVSDLVITKEVIEHLRPEQTADFLRYCRSSTRLIFALTTPNFSHWMAGSDPARLEAALATTDSPFWQHLKEETGHLRFVPDHFTFFNPASENPLDHKQAMTLEILERRLSEAFNPEEWEIRVMLGWPWTIVDHARVQTWTLYFKLYAVVLNRRLFEAYRKGQPPT